MSVLEFFRLGNGKVISCTISDTVLRIKAYIGGSDSVYTFIGLDYGYESGMEVGHSWFEADMFFIISGETKRKIGFIRPLEKGQKY